MRRACNVLVIGGGLAGVQAAEGVAQFVSDVLLADGRVAGVPRATGDDASMLAAYLAQDAGGVTDWKSTRVSLSVQGAGGPAADADGAAIRRGFHAYVADILAHGGGLCDPTLADFTAAGIYNRIGWLESYGLHVLRDAAGTYRGFPAPGHGLNRVLLIEEPAAEVLARVRRSAGVFGATLADGLYVTRILVEDGRVRGAYALDVRSGEPQVIETRAIVLAAGGADRLYGAAGTSGAAYGLALEAGASLANMEFVAFGPEPAIESGLAPGLLLILLGLGARLEPDAPARPQRARAQLHVPRDLLAAIADLPPFRPHVSALERPLPVRTGCRGLLGGIVHRAFGTAVEGLFVAGGCATGCHGADVLPGVDTSFTLYSAENAATAAATYWSRTRPLPLPELLVRGEDERLAELRARPGKAADLARVEDAVRETMWRDVGVARHARGLGEARRRLRALAAEVNQLGATGVAELVALAEAQALVTTAELVTEAAAMREESRGQHVRTDFPAADEARGRTWITVRKDGGAPAWSRTPVPVAG